MSVCKMRPMRKASDIPDHPQTLTALLDRALAGAGPDAPALYYGGRTVAYGSLAAEAARVAGFLHARGIGLGDRVAFWLPNTPAYLAAYFACAQLGAAAVAVNTRYRAAEAGDVLKRSRAKAMILWPAFRGIDFRGILAEMDAGALRTVKTSIVYDEAGDGVEFDLPECESIPYAKAADHAPYAGEHAAPDAPCNLFTTSGTTSAPKLVVHTQRSIAVHAAEVADRFGYRDPATVTLLALPLCGVFGFCQAMATLAAGRPMAMMSAFDAPEAVSLCTRRRVTQFQATDDMMDAMLRAAPDNTSFAALRFVGYAAFNRALEDLPERADARGVRLVGLWGMSEFQALAAMRDSAAPLAERRKAGGALVSPHAHARVRDPASGALLPPGQPGALELRGPSRMAGYLDDPAATAAALTGDGYVCTGDLAEIEPDGGFRFLTRMGDVLRLGGFLVAPAEIEAEIQAVPGVAAAQVVEVEADGRPRAFAFVTAAPGGAPCEGDILHHCAGRLAKYKVPADVIVLDAFPVTQSANGTKIQRTKLRAMAQAHVEDRASRDGG